MAGSSPKPWSWQSGSRGRGHTGGAGIFPTTGAAVRLIGALLAARHDEWQVGRRSFSAESLAPLRTPEEGSPTPALAAG